MEFYSFNDFSVALSCIVRNGSLTDPRNRIHFIKKDVV